MIGYEVHECCNIYGIDRNEKRILVGNLTRKRPLAILFITPYYVKV
jgi:hypothetical protein